MCSYVFLTRISAQVDMHMDCLMLLMHMCQN